jgi:hypothetical protein
MQKLRVFFAVLLTVVTLAHTTPSEAAVGKIIHSQKTVTVGLWMSGGGVAFAAAGVGLVSATCVDLGCLAVLFPIAVGGAVALAGLVTLDGEQNLQFKSLSQADAMKIGATTYEMQSFNSELDQANILLTDVSEQINNMKNATVEDSVRIWDEVRGLVSPSTFSAMQKIVSQK